MTSNSWRRQRALMATAVTEEALERSLDCIAEVMVQAGDRGQAGLPLYQWLERELQERRAFADAMSRVRARAKRSLDRKAERS